MSTRPGSLVVDPSVRDLGVDGYGVWHISSDRPLMDDRGEPVVPAASGEWVTAALPAYRDLLCRLGYPDTLPAGERTQASVTERGFPTYGGIVDVATALTVEFGGGVGLHRLTGEDDGADVLLTRSDGGHRMTPAFSSKARRIPEGDLVYGLRTDAGFEPCAWLGKRDCDSADRQVLSDTRAAIVVMQGGIDLPAGHREAQDRRLTELVRTYLPDAELTPLPVAG